MEQAFLFLRSWTWRCSATDLNSHPDSVHYDWMCRKALRVIILKRLKKEIDFSPLAIFPFKSGRTLKLIALYREAFQSTYRCSELLPTHLSAGHFRFCCTWKSGKQSYWDETVSFIWYEAPNDLSIATKDILSRELHLPYFFSWDLNCLGTLRLNPHKTTLGILFIFPPFFMPL